MGKNVGSVKVVGYLQEETNVNRNALTYYAYSLVSSSVLLRALIYVVTFLSP